VKLTHRIVINCEASNSSSKKLLSIGLGQEKDVLSIIMTPKIITIDADAKVEEALRLMAPVIIATRFSSLIIMNLKLHSVTFAR